MYIPTTILFATLAYLHSASAHFTLVGSREARALSKSDERFWPISTVPASIGGSLRTIKNCLMYPKFQPIMINSNIPRAFPFEIGNTAAHTGLCTAELYDSSNKLVAKLGTQKNCVSQFRAMKLNFRGIQCLNCVLRIFVAADHRGNGELENYDSCVDVSIVGQGGTMAQSSVETLRPVVSNPVQTPTVQHVFTVLNVPPPRPPTMETIPFGNGNPVGSGSPFGNGIPFGSGSPPGSLTLSGSNTLTGSSSQSGPSIPSAPIGLSGSLSSPGSAIRPSRPVVSSSPVAPVPIVPSPTPIATGSSGSVIPPNTVGATTDNCEGVPNGAMKCVGENQFVTCVWGKWVLKNVAAGTVCTQPLENIILMRLKAA